MVLNRAGRVFIGRRIDGPEHVDATHAWQMPQGGIDPGEDPWPAALRELREETNIRSVERLGEIADWLNYDIPRDIVGHAWSGKYRGQTQKWFALRFTGDESEIDIAHPGRRPRSRNSSPGAGSRLHNLPALVVPFKRGVYERVVASSNTCWRARSRPSDPSVTRRGAPSARRQRPSRPRGMTYRRSPPQLALRHAQRRLQALS